MGHFGWLYQDVIARGYRLGVAASGDEHRGRPGGGAPGVQVFGVRGGLTGVLAESLDRRSVGGASRPSYLGDDGEHTALLVQCGEYRQGDAFRHRGPATLDYRLLGNAGWEYVAAYDHTGVIWERDLHAELGYAQRHIRVRWGGARIRDRYRWASWRGTIRVLNGTIHNFRSTGFEHLEEAAWRSGRPTLASQAIPTAMPTASRLKWAATHATIVVEGTIDGFVKVGDPLAGNPFAHAPTFRHEIRGADLLAAGSATHQLGGTELFRHRTAD